MIMYASAPNWTLVASSQSFLIPITGYYLTREYTCSALIAGTYAVSMAYHATKPRYPILITLDIIFAQVGHLGSVYTTLQYLPYSLLPYSVFLSSAVIIYYHGKNTQTLAWDPNTDTATRWHAFMHAMLGMSAGVSIFLSGAARKVHHANSSS